MEQLTTLGLTTVARVPVRAKAHLRLQEGRCPGTASARARIVGEVAVTSVKARNGEASGHGQQRGKVKKVSGAASAGAASASDAAAISESARVVMFRRRHRKAVQGFVAEVVVRSLCCREAPLLSTHNAESCVAPSRHNSLCMRLTASHRSRHEFTFALRRHR